MTDIRKLEVVARALEQHRRSGGRSLTTTQPLVISQKTIDEVEVVLDAAEQYDKNH